MKRLMTFAIMAVVALSAMGSVAAHDDGHGGHGDRAGDGSGGGSGSYRRDRDWRDRETRGRATSYINPDIGLASANADVNQNSSCFNADRYDDQTLSDAGTQNRNVHNDACFLDRRGNKVDGPASFQSYGVGFISGCPDPDGAGSRYAVLSDTNGDGLNDLCFQSGYQQKGMSGDFEFHARLNNTTTAGQQTVVWCSDANMNGCNDERNASTIQINWTV